MRTGICSRYIFKHRRKQTILSAIASVFKIKPKRIRKFVEKGLFILNAGTKKNGIHIINMKVITP